MRITKKLKKYRKQILSGLALVFGVGLIALLVWIFHLDRIITTQFEGRRWTLPAQVYAEPTELYIGSPTTGAAVRSS
jgi:penicillin-binding protein 1B